jgi:hypothetical protein
VSEEKEFPPVQAVHEAITKAIATMIRRNQLSKEVVEVITPVLDYAKRCTEGHTECPAGPVAFAEVGKNLLNVAAVLTTFGYHVEEDHADDNLEASPSAPVTSGAVVEPSKDNVIHLDLSKTGRKLN